MYIDHIKLFPPYININEIYLSESVEYALFYLLCVHCILCGDDVGVCHQCPNAKIVSQHFPKIANTAK